MVSHQFANVAMALVPLLPIPFVAARFVTEETGMPILLITLLSLFAGYSCYKIIPVVAQYSLRRQICGMDINKKGTAAGEKKMYFIFFGFIFPLNFVVCILLSADPKHWVRKFFVVSVLRS